MKKILLSVVLATALALTSCQFDDSALWSKLDEYGESIRDHEQRISALEELCKQMNTNIEALQTLVDALEKRDYVTNVAPIREDGKVVGYTISFANSDTITIYNGKDGVNGKDGYAPQIGVMKDTDGIYYWTLDGEWLLDGKGNKIQANGVNGADGTNGSNGTNGTDGVTPQLKIENDYWYVSYDNGATWVQLGKATGNDGLNGENSEDGDSIFKSVTQDDEFVYFNLADGTMITLPKHDKENIQFEELQVKVICCENWDVNYDGELSYAEAAAVTTIGEVFRDNTNIIAFTELKYFTGMSELPENAFSGCTALWKIALPDNISIIGNRAFYGCESLISVKIHSKIQTIKEYAFCGCSKLKNVTICEGITSLGNGAFMNCINLIEVSLPRSIIEMGEHAFCQCNNLLKISIPSGVTTLNSSLFSGCSNLSEVVIPESVTKICGHAFYGCTNLESIFLPQYISRIEGQAFGKCTGIKNIYCKVLTPPAIYYLKDTYNSYGALPLNKDMIIYVPRESYDSYLQYTYKNSVNSTSIENWYWYESYIVPYDF